MKKYLLVLFLILFSSSFTSAMTTISGRPAPGGVATNYCNDANAQLCLYMNGNGTDETDRSANGYTLTDSASSPATSSTVPSGYSGTSRSFVSADAQQLSCTDANCPNLDINGASAVVSIAVWYYPTSIRGASQYQVIAGKYNSSDNQRQYSLSNYGSVGGTTMRFDFSVSNSYSSGAAPATTVSTSLANYGLNQWYHIVGVYNGTDMRIYINGSLACTPVTYTGGIFNGNNPFVISNDNYGYLDGYVDEVAVFNRALSAAEVADIYANGLTGNKGGSD